MTFNINPERYKNIINVNPTLIDTVAKGTESYIGAVALNTFAGATLFNPITAAAFGTGFYLLSSLFTYVFSNYDLADEPEAETSLTRLSLPEDTADYHYTDAKYGIAAFTTLYIMEKASIISPLSPLALPVTALFVGSAVTIVAAKHFNLINEVEGEDGDDDKEVEDEDLNIDWKQFGIEGIRYAAGAIAFNAIQQSVTISPINALVFGVASKVLFELTNFILNLHINFKSSYIHINKPLAARCISVASTFRLMRMFGMATPALSAFVGSAGQLTALFAAALIVKDHLSAHLAISRPNTNEFNIRDHKTKKYMNW